MRHVDKHAEADEQTKIRGWWNFEVDIKINHQKPKQQDKVIYLLVEKVVF